MTYSRNWEVRRNLYVSTPLSVTQGDVLAQHLKHISSYSNKAIKINESHDDQKGIKSSADNMIVFIENPKEITKKAIRNKWI